MLPSLTNRLLLFRISAYPITDRREHWELRELVVKEFRSWCWRLSWSPQTGSLHKFLGSLGAAGHSTVQCWPLYPQTCLPGRAKQQVSVAFNSLWYFYYTYAAPPGSVFWGHPSWIERFLTVYSSVVNLLWKLFIEVSMIGIMSSLAVAVWLAEICVVRPLMIHSSKCCVCISWNWWVVLTVVIRMAFAS